MLDVFTSWARQIAGSSGHGISAAWVTESDVSDNRSARLDVDALHAVARITCWESGEFDAEVVGLVSEETLYATHGTVRLDVPLSEQFRPFLRAVDSLPG